MVSGLAATSIFMRGGFRLQTRTRPGSSFFSNDLRIQMTALAQTLSRLTGMHVDAEALEPICIFCSIGLLLSLLATKAYGMDLSLAFF